MRYFFLILVFNLSNFIKAQEYTYAARSLKELCLHAVAKLIAQHNIPNKPMLTTDLMLDLVQNYNHNPSQKCPISYLNDSAKIITINMLYCFTQAKNNAIQRMDLLSTSLIEKNDIGKLNAVSDNGCYCIFSDHGTTSFYDFRSNNKVIIAPSNQAWICNNKYLICLQSDLLSIWKIDLLQSQITHHQSLPHIKNCYTFPWQSQIVTLNQTHNTYTYSLYDCERNLTLASWQVPEPCILCVTHPEKNIIATTHRYQKQNLYLYHPLKPHNSRCLEHPAAVIAACFVPKKPTIITCTDQPDNTIRLWDTSENKKIALCSIGTKQIIESLWLLPSGLYAQDKNGNCWYWHQKTITHYQQALDRLGINTNY